VSPWVRNFANIGYVCLLALKLVLLFYSAATLQPACKIINLNPRSSDDFPFMLVHILLQNLYLKTMKTSNTLLTKIADYF